ncbi:uncharacterized protein KIAA1143 homolog [Folsomia candida]|uniref:DUF4604 domain-containing protein n=1 Tax=Folsomia candida TaxID=158441 RepID=A0A226DNI0_FOLCA|nr:uncharacterized protein KIAA1143 homolog [Folsomia candida]OXA47092.1 hypothetical protein Fcan01_18520 [Folsomia candida]
MGGRGRGKKQPVSFINPAEPAFIRRMKEQLGYKEGPNIDTKREELEKATIADEIDREDELPTVVVLKSGDLTEEEAKRIDADVLKEEDADSDGKIAFKKPVKRPAVQDEADKIKKKLEKKESQMAPVKNKSLLSFDDEEDDDD